MANKTWFRLYTEITRDRKIRRLQPSYRWVWITILCMAKESPIPGCLFLSDSLPVHPEDIADEAAVDIKDVEQSLEAFINLNMLLRTDGVYMISHWDERQYKSDSSTERVQRYRENVKCNTDVTFQECYGNNNETPPDTDTDTDTESDTDTDGNKNKNKCDTPAEIPKNGGAQNKKTGKGSYTEDFEQFWRLYPRRIDKAKAFRAWNARLKDKIDPNIIVQATVNYSKYCKVQRTEERFIKHPSTFIGPDKPFEEFIDRNLPGQTNGPKSWSALQQLQSEYEEEENGEKDRDD